MQRAVIALALALFALQSPPLSSIHGIVLDADTNMPVSGVTVFDRAQTDSDGRFQLDNLPPGSLVVAVNRRGTTEGALRFTLEPGQKIENAVLRIRTRDSGTGAVTGHVFDLQGHPVARAIVNLYQYGYGPRPLLMGDGEVRPRLQLVCCDATRGEGTRTDDRGEFRLYGIAPGHYVVLIGGCRSNSTAISSPRGPSLCSSQPLGATLYPGVSDASKAVVIEVKPGDETRLDNLVLPPALGKIQVHLVDENGETMSGTNGLGTVFFMFAGFRYGGFMQYTPILTESVVPVRGQAEMAVDFVGTYIIDAGVAVSGSNYQGQAIVDFLGVDTAVTIKLANKTPDSGVGYRLMDGSVIQGHVTVEAPDAAFSSPFGQSPLQLLFTDVPASPLLEPTLFAANVQADGTFRISQVHSGAYRLIGFRPSPQVRIDKTYTDYFILSAHQGKTDVLNGPLEIPIGETRDVNVVLSPSGSILRGTVADANHHVVHNAVVAVLPDGVLSRRMDREKTFRTERTDQNGVFETHGLAPGSYRAYAWYESDTARPTRDLSGGQSFQSIVEDGAIYDEEFMKKFESSAVPIEVAKDASATFDVKIISHP